MRFRNKNAVLFFASMLMVCGPFVARADVKINEIAWMGSGESQFAEWIEFHNDSATEVDLKDAALYADGGSALVIKMTKKIAPQGYYLVTRTTASSPDPFPGLSDDSGTFSGGGFSNSGEFLVLKDKNGTTLDGLDNHAGWIAGDNATKKTMQWTGTAWITATATPRAQNASAPVSTNTTSDSNNTATSTATSTAVAAAETSSSVSTHSSPAALSTVPEVRDFNVSAGRERLVSVGNPLVFEAKTKDTPSGQAVDFRWSFGDGGTAQGKSVTKTYYFPGDYIVVVNASAGQSTAVSRTKVRVVPVLVDLKSESADSHIELFNRSPHELNIGTWQIVSGNSHFTIPADTIIPGGGQTFISQRVSRLIIPASSTVALLYPDGTSMVSFLVDHILMSQRDLDALSTVVTSLSDQIAAIGERVKELLAH